MLFADNMVCVGESTKEFNTKLEEGRTVPEGKQMHLSRTKTKYLSCKFSGMEQQNDPKV